MLFHIRVVLFINEYDAPANAEAEGPRLIGRNIQKNFLVSNEKCTDVFRTTK